MIAALALTLQASSALRSVPRVMQSDGVVRRVHSGLRADLRRVVHQANERIRSVCTLAVVFDTYDKRTHWAAAAVVQLRLLESLRPLLSLRVVASQLLDVFEISVVDAAGDVFSREDGAIESLDSRVELSAGFDEVRKGLENDEIGTNVFGDLFDGSIVGDEFLRRWHVDTVDVGVSDISKDEDVFVTIELTG